MLQRVPVVESVAGRSHPVPSLSIPDLTSTMISMARMPGQTSEVLIATTPCNVKMPATLSSSIALNLSAAR
jgi:hypothetical protein